MPLIELIEKYNKEKYKKVLYCKNIPIDDENNEKDAIWLETFKKNLLTYNGRITYHHSRKSKYGRLQGNGMQTFPREIRKYLADGIYVDLDIVNAHLVFIEIIMIHNGIEVPIFLKEYNTNKQQTIEKYDLKDKLYMIKLINNEVCYDKRINIREFHNVLYSKVLPILKREYNDLDVSSKEKNKDGSFLSICLQDIENKILMCMYKKCVELKVKVGVLIFDGLMIEKESYKEELLWILEKEIKEKLNYEVSITEKSMETDWEPDFGIEEDYKKLISVNFDDTVSNMTCGDNAITSDVNNMLIKKMICECNVPEHKYNLLTKGIACSCVKCGGSFPREGLIPMGNHYKSLVNYLNVNVTINNNTINYNRETDHGLEYQIENDIYNDEEVTRLVNQSLDGHKISEISKLLKNQHPNFVYENVWYVFENNMWTEDVGELSLKTKALQLKELFSKVRIYYNQTKTNESSTIIKNVKSLEQKLSKPGFKEEIIKEAKLFYNEKGFAYKLNSKKHLVPFTNGVFDLLENKFRVAKKDDYIKLNCGFEYDPSVRNKDVITFLEQVLPNKGVRDYVLKRMSDCLNGDIPNTTFMMFIGDSGANGKSQLLNLGKLTMGGFGEKVEVTLLTRKRNNANETNSEKIKLMYKRYAFLSEPEDGEKINIGLLKELTGSEEIVARGLYQESMSFVMEAKLFLACNELPEIKGEDSAIWRRVRVVDFPSRFIDDPKEEGEFKIDRTLPSRMREDITWKQTFLNILLEYYYKDVNEPREVKIKTNEYQEENDTNRKFVERHIIKKTGKNITWDDLWRVYQNWYLDEHGNINGMKKKTEVKKYFSDKIFKKKEYVIKVDNTSKRGWCGFILNDEYVS